MPGSFRWLLVAGVFVLAAGAAADVPIPPRPAHHFNDYAGVVPDPVDQRLDQKLQGFEAQTGHQVVVAVFAELPGPSLEDFTVRTAQAWGVGRAKDDDGVVLFVFVKNRKIRIEVGYGLEGALPDATAKRIIAESIGPRFKAGDYAGGLDAGIGAILGAIRGDRPPPAAAPAVPAAPVGGAPRSRGLDVPAWFIGFVCPLLALILLIVIVHALSDQSFTYSGRGWESRGWSSSSSWSDSGSSGSSSFGSSGGGFSGGGGSFGGGGASGDW